MRATFCALAALVIFAGAAAGDWQATHWGMKPDEVVKATDGKAVPTSGEERAKSPHVLLKIEPYVVGEYRFRADFEFKDGGLSGVDLSLISGDPNALVGSLQRKYGEPFEVEPGVLKSITWHAGGDQINYTMARSLSVIDYRPLKGKDTEGL